jgi:hypothetical protein
MVLHPDGCSGLRTLNVWGARRFGCLKTGKGKEKGKAIPVTGHGGTIWL